MLSLLWLLWRYSHLPVYCDSTQFSLTVVTVHTDCYDRYKIFPDCYESTYSLLIISDCNYSTQFFLTVMIVLSFPVFPYCYDSTQISLTVMTVLSFHWLLWQPSVFPDCYDSAQFSLTVKIVHAQFFFTVVTVLSFPWLLW